MQLGYRYGCLAAHALLIFWTSLAVAVEQDDQQQQSILTDSSRKGYTAGASVPVSCLNRTIETGEHIEDAGGGLQYIPFPVCNETGQPLSFVYGEPAARSCTIEILEDEMYHLFEFYVHNDVPLTCRIPSYPISSSPFDSKDASSSTTSTTTNSANQWTPLTIALQGALQLSHLHIHTTINVLLHTTSPSLSSSSSRGGGESHLIAATAYSLPNVTRETPYPEGAKIIRGEPLTFVFNVGWVEGAILPGMVGKPLQRAAVTDHGAGFFFLCVFACLASAGVGGMAVMQFERRKWRTGKMGMDGLLGGSGGGMNNGRGGVGGGGGGVNGYGGYGGYSSLGKRD